MTIFVMHASREELQSFRAEVGPRLPVRIWIGV